MRVFRNTAKPPFEFKPRSVFHGAKFHVGPRQSAEIFIHFPGPAGLNEPSIWVFPSLSVCMKCGRAEFSIPGNEFRELSNGTGNGESKMSIILKGATEKSMHKGLPVTQGTCPKPRSPLENEVAQT